MKVRIISGVIGFCILLAVLWAGKLVLGLAVSIVCLIALYEFYKSVSKAGYKPVKLPGYLSAFILAFLGVDHSLTPAGFSGVLVLFIFLSIVFLFSFIIFLNKKHNIIDISLSFFSIFYITFLFSFIILTRNLPGGKYLVWFIFIGAWATDTFAYFSGRFFGKRKLIPSISPKKTVEGSIGGVIGCMLITVLYGMYLSNINMLNGFVVYHLIPLGFLCGIVSQIGDLAASSIKRYVNVKDFGNIMPGHGGALDRFDSILFCAPVVYFYINILYLL
ncbi:phosphatidate cytidylyltransferase [Acetivibrio saccincola]|uniref:Phosphatidate cytidylyltransferase n=1 Tax=Acetivibrio saccincola TaxID=1677857 RepID=A0A2K9E493_9FIRM|nr:phosphatidate cytidylyltransferase [Acetivibrio saccincola]AUG57218.1 Phosphatidate cytidylyltransferase [Acetivibrio saccincola]PQQ67197.1 phosphatidate cytidylyltransferase [Acetivibrio saccincola]HOA97155.1 phosphatidate cytidylyltransferase [Acetivibrio saccincola]